MRNAKRRDDELRPIRFIPDYIRNTPGSVLVEQGNTRVVCTALLEERVPPFMKNSGKGWISAEYSMLPGSCGRQRVARERLKVNNRHGEIQRFVSRALRSTIDLKSMGERMITIDADVIQGDGSTRCASVNGGMIALALALKYLVYEQLIADFPALLLVSAVSIGLGGGRILADLDYEEDSSVDMDLNVVASEDGRLVEVQGFAEHQPVPSEKFQEMLGVGLSCCKDITAIQKQILVDQGIPFSFA